MKADIKAKWLEALRSGRYIQGMEALARKTEAGVQYCCLGVLCELAVEAGVAKREKPPHYDDPDYTYRAGSGRDEDESQSMLPEAVKEWAGLDHCNPFVDVPEEEAEEEGERSSLAELNDSRLSFVKIADIIEDQL